MPFATAHDGVKLHYEVHDYTDPWNPGPVLILQHGFGRSGKFWFNLMPYLTRFYRVVCPDLRGLGQSPADFDPAQAISVENYLSDIIAVADAVGAKTFHYAGESLGGMLGMVLAATHPDRVRTLTLMSASLTLRPEIQKTFAYGHASWQEALRILGSKGWSDATNAATRFPPGTDTRLTDWYRDEFGKSNVDVLIAMSRLAATLDAEPVLEKITTPTLGLYPSGGAFQKSGQQDVLTGKLKTLKMVHMPSSYHMVWVMAPAACADQMLHFMALHDGIVCHE
jgi:3-oxoadipate enol-lactonase